MAVIYLSVVPWTAHDVLPDIKGDQLELELEFELNSASFCGINLLCDHQGNGGLAMIWSGNELNVDGVSIPLPNWSKQQSLQLQIFIDQQIVEVFVNQGKYCVSRKVSVKNIKGDRISLTSLGGTARLKSLKTWKLKPVN